MQLDLFDIKMQLFKNEFLKVRKGSNICSYRNEELICESIIVYPIENFHGSQNKPCSVDVHVSYLAWKRCLSTMFLLTV